MIKVFYHNYYNGENFVDQDEALYSIKDNKYSIFKEVQAQHRINNKFEFILYYPQLKPQYNHWRQTNSPHIEGDVKGKTKAVGYEPVKIDWEYYSWGGLCRNTFSNTNFIDGTLGGAGWFYALGKFDVETGWDKTTFPGPNVGLKEVFLWMRVKDYMKYDIITCYIKVLSSFSNQVFIIFLLISL